MVTMSRKAYAEMYGPTTGDRVRLGDTELWIEVEKDFTVYGDEVKFGGGKVIRDGQGQSQALARRRRWQWQGQWQGQASGLGQAEAGRR